MESENKNRYLLLVIILLGLFLRVSLSLDPYLHAWDERFHALVAKNLLEDPTVPVLYKDPVLWYNYKAWFSNHTWLHKQPLPLYLIAICYKIFGVSEFLTRLPSILFSSLGICVIYLLGRSMFNKRTALLAAFFMAINGLIVEMCSGRISTDHYDILFMLFILFGIYFAYRGRMGDFRMSVLSGLFMGMAILTKWLPALIVLPVHLVFLWGTVGSFRFCIKPLLTSFFVACLVALPWQLYILHTHPLEAKWEYYHNWLHITSELDNQSGGYFYYLEQIRVNYSEIIYLPLLFLPVALIRSRFSETRYFALFVWIVVPLIFFSLVKTKMQGYIMFIAPALFLITAEFFFLVLQKTQQAEGNKAMKVFGNLFLVAAIVLPIRYCYERTGFGFKKGEEELVKEAKEYSDPRIPEHALIMGIPNPIEFMYYNDGCVAYPETKIDSADVFAANQKGYRVYLYHDHAYKEWRQGKMPD